MDLKDEIRQYEVEEKEVYDETETEIENQDKEDEKTRKERLHAEAEKDIIEGFTEDTPLEYTKAYLSEKITQIYGNDLAYAGIIDVEKYLENELYDFNGVESYKKIIEDIESGIECGKQIEQEVKQMEELDNTQEEVNKLLSVKEIGKGTINMTTSEKDVALQQIQKDQKQIQQLKEPKNTIHNK